MRLTTFSDYALRVLMYLGAKEDRAAQIHRISEHYGISRNHLMKVVRALGREGYLHTIRGKHGGIYLDRAPESINLGALIRTMESDFALVECFAPGNQCAITSCCRLTPILAEALNAFLAVLDRYTLADLLDSPAELRTALGLDKTAV